MANAPAVFGYGGTDTGSISTIDGYLMEHYPERKIREIINKSTYLFSKLKAEKTTEGRRSVYSVEFAVHAGAGAMNERDEYPDAGITEERQLYEYVKYLASVFSITLPAIAATRNNVGAMAKALERQMDKTKEGLMLAQQRQVWSDGAGTLAKVKTTVNSTIIPVSYPYGYTYSETDLADADRTMTLRKNMKVHIYTSGGGGTDLYRKISKVNSDGTITLTASASVTAGDLIRIGDSATQNSADKEISGLGKLISNTGTYLGVTRADYQEWQSNIIALPGSGELTEDLLQQATDQASRFGTAPPTDLISNFKERRLFLNLLTTQRQFTTPTVFEGGFEVLKWNGFTWAVDKDCPPQRIWMPRIADIWWIYLPVAEGQKEGFDRTEGTVLKRVGRTMEYEAVYYAWKNLMTLAPANHTLLTNVLN